LVFERNLFIFPDVERKKGKRGGGSSVLQGKEQIFSQS